ncbi:MAG: hypothetical protein LBF85_03005 [Tannerella sp.]|jgi:uncharacterized membrane protein|nr:hypothetical protein [Tannerella sp.]
MTKNEQWSKATAMIFNGILLYSIAGILHSIVDPIESIMSAANTFSPFAGGGNVPGADGLSNFLLLLTAAIIGGYVMYMLGLGRFAEILDAGDSAAVRKIRTGVILGMVGEVMTQFPLVGWLIGGIINIVAFILMMTGYSALKSSPTFPAAARSGAGKLFASQILLIIGTLLGWIPFIGGVFEGILDLVAFILLLVGWAAIKNTRPEAPAYSMPDMPQAPRP